VTAGARLEGRWFAVQLGFHRFLHFFLRELVMDENETNAPPPVPHSIEALIERWWADHFSGSPVAQVTQAWNHAFAAKEDLKRRLKELTSEA
jgi:hypothetical protein